VNATVTRDRIARASWSTPVVLALAAVSVRLGALLSSKHLTFDDGNYGVSVVDMRHGLAPYADVFSSQGPLHLPLLYAGDLLGLHTMDGPRITPVLSGVAVTIAVWGTARRFGARPAVAVVAALLVGTTGSMIWATAPITGDGPSCALMACAVWSAVVFRDEPSAGSALCTGALAGAAIATKPLVFPALIPIAWWLGAPRRLRPTVEAAAAATAVWFLAALPWELSRVWRQSVTYHTGRAPTYSAGFQFDKLVSLLVLRDAILVAAVVLGLIALVRRRGGPPLRDGPVIALWTALVAFVLVFEHAMYANHLATIVLPLSLLFACYPPPLRWLAIALIPLVPWSLVNLNDILVPRGYTGPDAQVVAELRALPRGAQVISDETGLVWRAGRSTPPQMNDTTLIRTYQGLLTTNTVARAASEPATCAVVIWTFRFDQRMPGLREALVARDYRVQTVWEPGKELWVKQTCTS
jgi:hypothetical protein